MPAARKGLLDPGDIAGPVGIVDHQQIERRAAHGIERLVGRHLESARVHVHRSEQLRGAFGGDHAPA